LTRLLRKKLGSATIQSVQELKAESAEKTDPTPSQYPVPLYHANTVAYPDQYPLYHADAVVSDQYPSCHNTRLASLTRLLRKKLGSATIQSVQELKAESAEKTDPTPSQYPVPLYHANTVAYPDQYPLYHADAVVSDQYPSCHNVTDI
ncbi:hypothetical protein CFP56_032588, partial [Quercus suber]